MTLVLLALGVAVAFLPRWLGSRARRTSPRERVWLGVIAIVLGALLVELALVLLAVPTVLAGLGNEALARRCHWLTTLAPGGEWPGWAAAVLAVFLPMLVRRGWRRATETTHVMRAESVVGTHHSDVEGVDIVQLPTDVPVAYSIDGDRPQIVVSDGLVSLLSVTELDVVVRHEQAHVREGHGRILRFLTALETAGPPVHSVTRPVRVAIEQCADEIATGCDPGRRDALLDALVKLSGLGAPMPVAAIASVSGVVERADALLLGVPASAKVPRVVARAVLVGASISALSVVAVWGLQAHMLLSMSGCS